MRINIDITVAMKCQREYRNYFKFENVAATNKKVDSFVFHAADVGADILDLAETMITSSGLQYEPVREAHL